MFRDLTCSSLRPASAALAALMAPLFVALLLLPADRSEAQTSTPSLSVADIRKITTGYRAAARYIARKEAFVIESLRRYPGATTTLNVLIGRELQPQILSYANDLKKEATRAFASRLAKFGRAKVQQLQMQVNALREDPNLTKEMIKTSGLPAITELGMNLLPGAAEILGDSQKLLEKRQDLLRLGLLWDMTQAPGTAPFAQRLESKEKATLISALPMPPNAIRILHSNQLLSKNLEREESEAVAALNETRILLGLMPVLIDPLLTAAARSHSAEMERLGYFDHTSPTPGREHFAQRAQLHGTTANAENIYMNTQPDGRVANQAWFVSPGHHRNMLGNYSRVGLGRSGAYFTQMFAR